MKLQDFQTSLVFGSIWGCMMLTSYLIYRIGQTSGSCEWMKSMEPVGQTLGCIGVGSIPIIVGLFVYEYIIAQI